MSTVSKEGEEKRKKKGYLPLRTYVCIYTNVATHIKSVYHHQHVSTRGTTQYLPIDGKNRRRREKMKKKGEGRREVKITATLTVREEEKKE